MNPVTTRRLSLRTERASFRNPLAQLGFGWALAVLTASPSLATAQTRPPSPPAKNGNGAPARDPVAGDGGQARLRALVVPGGLTADQVARLAVASSPELRGREAGTDAARARGSQATAEFWPRLGLNARYNRLSHIDPPDLGNGFTFPVFVNNYSMGATISVPVSDYLLRTARSYRASKHGIAASKLETEATRRKVVADARLAYYDWIRARGQLLVVEQRAETAQAQVTDAGRLFEAGAVSKADVLSARAQAKSVELALVRARQLAELTTTRLRVATHETQANYQVGEDIFAALPPVAGVDNLESLYKEALGSRPELAALRETVAATDALAKLAGSGWWPRLELVGGITNANPNPRIFPPRQKWDMTWDAGIVLTYAVTDLFGVSGRVREQEARGREISAQADALLDGLRVEVQEAASAVNAANSAVEAAEQALLASDEGYRVRRELYLVGRATLLEVTSAETELMTARLQVIDANVEARQARVRLTRAVGRDAIQ
ncbi:MAG TPA: TolC family protein [Polyangia bacterium]